MACPTCIRSATRPARCDSSNAFRIKCDQSRILDHRDNDFSPTDFLPNPDFFSGLAGHLFIYTDAGASAIFPRT